jgi:type IV secretory pathway VirD2 relaxase
MSEVSRDKPSRDPQQIGKTGGRPRASPGGIPSVARLMGKALGKGWMKRAKAGGSARKKSSSGGVGKGFRQRVVVKALVVRHGIRTTKAGVSGGGVGLSKGGASLARHVRYLGRGGTSEKGERGQFYDRDVEGLEAGELTKEWHRETVGESAPDQHHFRLIISPEKGEQIADLKAYVREVMARVERDVQHEAGQGSSEGSGKGSKRGSNGASGDRLEWLAINHFNTDQPHAHVLIRGVTGPLVERSAGRSIEGSIERSKEPSPEHKVGARNHAHKVIDPFNARVLILSRQTISHGLRNRAEEVATELLGERSLDEIRHAREKEVGAERWTGLDRQIARQIDLQSDSEILPKTARSTPRSPHAIDIAPDRLQGVSGHERGLLVRRLQTLQQLGLATPTRGSTWRVDPDFRERLTALGTRGDIIKTLYANHGTQAHAWAGRVVPFGLADRLENRAAKPLEGVVVAHGVAADVMGEMTLERYLVVRDGKGQDHYATVREGAAYDRVQNGATVVLGRAGFDQDQGIKEIIRVAESIRDRLYSVTAHRADLATRDDLTKSDRDRLIDLAARQAEQLAGRAGAGIERDVEGVFKVIPAQLQKHAQRQLSRSITDVRVLSGGRDLGRQRASRSREQFTPEPGRSMPVTSRSRLTRSRDDRDDRER